MESEGALRGEGECREERGDIRSRTPDSED